MMEKSPAIQNRENTKTKRPGEHEAPEGNIDIQDTTPTTEDRLQNENREDLRNCQRVSSWLQTSLRETCVHPGALRGSY